MKATQLFWLCGITALVSACDLVDGGDDDTAITDDSATDTDTDGGEVLAWNDDFWSPDWKAFVDCGTSGEVSFEAESTRWGAEVAELYLAQTDNFGEFRGWDENHDLDETDASDNESGFSKYGLTLETGATLETQAMNVSTLFNCTGDAGIINPTSELFEVTFALALWAPGADRSTDDPSDCVVFGNDAAGLIADPSGNERPNAPDWLTDANCRAL